MWFVKNILIFQILGFLIFHDHFDCQAFPRHYFVVRDVPYTRLCSTKKILTVNGQFPGPTLRVHRGDTIIVSVYNRANYNITLHWHGVKQPRNPWTDGPEYITQCPIKPGGNFNQKIIFSTEEGTIWWHAHSDWSRATVHGAIIVYPKVGTSYPFPKPFGELPIILGEWWNKDVNEILEETLKTGADFNVSDAFTINGQPGDLYACSKSETVKLTIFSGKTYLLRIVNAALNDILFFGITKHNLTVVGADGSYTKPLTRDFIVISPGQTIDALLHTNQQPNQYYMAAKAYSSGSGVSYDNTTTTAILNYYGHPYTTNTTLSLPYLPKYNDTTASINFSASLRSLADKNHPINVPLSITTRIITTISVNKQPCPVNRTCDGPDGSRLAASMNNISFSSPSIDILEAYYRRINGVFGDGFPSFPPFLFNFTGDDIPSILEIARQGTEVKVLDYNSTVEMVFQGTNLVAGIDHPMHLHGYSFYVMGLGLGNFDPVKDPLKYNLVDPPLRNTVAVPKNGWTTIRFKASNPGVWFMHCHLERHLSWGMETVFIVKNGERPEARLPPPPPDMPPC